MTNTEWKEMALANEDKIKQALRNAFQNSIGTIRDSWSYKVILDAEGNVGIYLLGQNEHLMKESITVASFQRDTLENCGWELVDWLENDERTALEKWAEENGYDTAWLSDSHVQEWNPEVYDRAYAEREEDFFDTHLEDNIMDAWDRFFMDLDLR
jgi:hypothetical protein